VHRDLKPGNLLLQPGGRPPARFKLTDFGLAAPLGTRRELGVFSGCLPYVPPEALLGRELDARADLYGLGILLYQLSTGRLPVPDGRAEPTVRWHLSGPPADPARARPDLPERWARFVRRLTERDPEARPRSALEALALLGRPRRGFGAPGRVACRDRAARASLRLALDATRLGAARSFTLPAHDTGGLRREAAVWSQVRGLAFRRLDGRAPHALARLVHRLLIERPEDAALCVRRYGLERTVGVRMLGGLPILDPGDRPAPAASADVQAVHDFIAGCARRRTLVLSVEGSPRPGLAREVVRRLAASASGGDRFALDGGGGLLLLLPPGWELPAARGVASAGGPNPYCRHALQASLPPGHPQ
jgi:hypothetical protein